MISQPDPVIEPWRRLGLLVFLIGALGTAAELGLLGHFEDRPQWTPLAFLGLGVAAAVWLAIRPSRASVVGFGFAAATYLPVAAAGLYFHIRSNAEFELEMRPSIAGRELAWESLTGAMPALAPGSMALLGMIGLLVCFRHPMTRSPKA